MAIEAKYCAEGCPKCGAPCAVVNYKWLREVRLASQLTLSQMADRLGYSVPYMSDIERGKRDCTQRVREAYEQLESA